MYALAFSLTNKHTHTNNRTLYQRRSCHYELFHALILKTNTTKYYYSYYRSYFINTFFRYAIVFSWCFNVKRLILRLSLKIESIHIHTPHRMNTPIKSENGHGNSSLIEMNYFLFGTWLFINFGLLFGWDTSCEVLWIVTRAYMNITVVTR